MKSDNCNLSSDSENENPGPSSSINRVRSHSAGSIPNCDELWKPQANSSNTHIVKPCLVSRDTVAPNEFLMTVNQNIETEESNSIASTAVSNAINIVSKDISNVEAVTNIALEKVDLGGTALPEGVLRAAGVPLHEINVTASHQIAAQQPSRRRSSQVSIKRTSQSRSPPPPDFYQNLHDLQNSTTVSPPNLSDADVSNRLNAPPIAASFESTPDILMPEMNSVIPTAPLAEAVLNAIYTQHGVNSKLIRRSTSAATSYMASDEDNSQEDDSHNEEVHASAAGSNRRRSKKLSSGLRKRSSIRQSTDNHDDASTNLESGYGASNFSITSSGRSSVGASNKFVNGNLSGQNKSSNGNESCDPKRHSNHHRQVRIVDRRDSDDDHPSAFEPILSAKGAKCTYPHQKPSDEDRSSLDDILDSQHLGASSSQGPQKHVTLDVRFADFADSDASLPPNTGDRQSMSARNSTTGSECLGFGPQNVRMNRNHSLCGEVHSLNPCSFKSISAGHSVNMTPSRQGSFSISRGHPLDAVLLNSEICCYYCYMNSTVGQSFERGSRGAASEEPLGDSNSSDEHAKKVAAGAGARRCSSGGQSLSEPQYIVNLSSYDVPPRMDRACSLRSSDEYNRPSADFDTGSKWKSRNRSVPHQDSVSLCSIHRNLRQNGVNHEGEKRTANFLVDGVRFQIDTRMLQAQPDTMLGRMFSSTFSENLNLSADIPLGMHSPDLSATVFRTILDFYLRGKMTCPPDLDIHSLKVACDYFLIPFNYHTIRCNNIRAFLHELSDDGAYHAFEGFFDMHILPKLVECTRSGERECHLVVLMDDETISWDEEYPPQMPDNELNAHLVFSTHMYRFLKYNENREVAKKFLSAKYLKKIRIGIEGYPTYKERVKYRGHRPEVIYNYAQRPFIHMSWEHEENKSRHVDFQCVKSKSATDLTALEQVLGTADDLDLASQDTVDSGAQPPDRLAEEQAVETGGQSEEPQVRPPDEEPAVVTETNTGAPIN